MHRARVGVAVVAVVVTMGIAQAGYKFSGFTKDGTKYRTEYDGLVCDTGVVDDQGAVTRAAVCHDPTAKEMAGKAGADFGYTRSARSIADGRLRLRMAGNETFVDVSVVDDQGASQRLIHHDTGAAVRKEIGGNMWWHTDKRILAVEYVSRTSVIGYDVSAAVARIEKALGPVTTAARVPLWGGVWKHAGYGCTGINVELTFKKKGVAQAVIAGECLTVKLGGKKKGTWSKAEDGTVSVVMGGETTTCALAACPAGGMDFDDVCLDCGGASYRQ